MLFNKLQKSKYLIICDLEGGQLLRISDVSSDDIGEMFCIVTTSADSVISNSAVLSLQKVDCVLSNWSHWSPCTVSCGGGQRSRSRIIEQEAGWGGRECIGDLGETSSCNNECCLPICDQHALLKNSTQHPCGECVCSPGWAGPGALCGLDNDADGWSDVELDCNYSLTRKWIKQKMLI